MHRGEPHAIAKLSTLYENPSCNVSRRQQQRPQSANPRISHHSRPSSPSSPRSSAASFSSSSAPTFSSNHQISHQRTHQQQSDSSVSHAQVVRPYLAAGAVSQNVMLQMQQQQQQQQQQTLSKRPQSANPSTRKPQGAITRPRSAASTTRNKPSKLPPDYEETNQSFSEEIQELDFFELKLKGYTK